MSFWQGRKVLVTGASGFVGSHLIRNLILRGAKVIAPSKRIGPIEDFEKLNSIVKRNKIHTIFHLAAQPIVEVGQTSPIKTFEVNIKGTWNILEAARQQNVQKIIIASTTHVYGDNPNVPYKEDYFPQPSRPYETSKACADLLAQSFADSFNMQIEIPRFVNIYGPGDLNFTRLIPMVMKSILNGGPIKIWDVGSVRDFLYIDDAIRAYLMLAEKNLPNKKRVRVFNFGTGKPIKIIDLVLKILSLAKKDNLDIKMEPTPTGRTNEIPRQYVSVNKSKRLLHWYPQTSLENGLVKTFNWYKRNLKSLL